MISLVAIAIALILISATIWLIQQNSTQTAKHDAQRNVKYIHADNIYVSMIKGKAPEMESLKTIRREGKVYGTKALNAFTITCADPDIVQLVLSKEFTNFMNRRPFKLNHPIFDCFMAVAQNEQWKRIRAIVTPTFAHGSLRRIKPRLDETISTLLDNLDSQIANSQIVNCKEIFGSFTMDSILQVAFGVKVNSLTEKNNPLIENSKKLMSREVGTLKLIHIVLTFMFPRLGTLSVAFPAEVYQFLQEFSIQIIEQKREEIKRSGLHQAKGTSFLELLIEAEANHQKETGVQRGDDKEHSSKFMSNNEMIAQAIQFLNAGYETTANLLSLSAYLLALHPQVQSRLHKEVETIISKLSQHSPETDDPLNLVTFESISQFEYLSAVINETLRLYPPGLFLERRAENDITLKSSNVEVNVKSGDIVSIPVFAIHHDEDLWSEPEAFNPDRFIGESQHHKYAFLPFGGGPRGCVAKSLALLEAKLALIHTVRKFKFSKCEKTKIPMTFYNVHGNTRTPREVILKVEKR